MDRLAIIGVIAAVIAIALSFIITAGKSSRDTVVIAYPTDQLLHLLRGWAHAHGYRESAEGQTLLFRRGDSVWTPGIKVQLTQVPQGHQLQAWIELVGIGKRRDLALTAPGVISLFPRNKALREVNDLLAHLRHPQLTKN